VLLSVRTGTARGGDLLDDSWTKSRTPQRLQIEAERQLALNESEVACYIEGRGASSSLGSVVHRLLAIKYPRPSLPQGRDLPRLKVNVWNFASFWFKNLVLNTKLCLLFIVKIDVLN
jgi:hypothetical protein